MRRNWQKRLKFAGLLTALQLAQPAGAMVGDTAPAPELSQNLVMVLTRSGQGAGFCTASVVAPNAVLTAAHCVTSAENMRVHFGDTASPPRLIEVAQVAVHPGYHANAITTRERSIDLALVRLKSPLPAGFTPLPFGDWQDFNFGTALQLAGFGLSQEGDDRAAGKLLRTNVQVRPPFSSLLLWMEGQGSGACTGDSGGPVLQNGALVGVISWTTGVAGHHCGALTQAIRLAPHMGWVKGVLGGW